MFNEVNIPWLALWEAGRGGSGRPGSCSGGSPEQPRERLHIGSSTYLVMLRLTSTFKHPPVGTERALKVVAIKLSAC